MQGIEPVPLACKASALPYELHLLHFLHQDMFNLIIKLDLYETSNVAAVFPSCSIL